MPDGELSPEQQINTEVTFDQSQHHVDEAFGTTRDTALGGGTPNAAWMFTDLNELDKLIHQWIDIKEQLVRHTQTITYARVTVKPPAGDIMSGFQANAFQKSLEVLQQHTLDMAAYAEEYATKLREARSGYSAAEETIAAKLDGTHG